MDKEENDRKDEQ
jgi:hypothetical protein